VPLLTVIAGPNGSGKSSVTRQLDFEGKNNLLDPDAVARRLDSEDPRRAAVSAGREVILRTRQYVANRESFAFETTLSSGGPLATIKEAQLQGFTVSVVYVCLNHPERNTQRVRERVRQGGHDVPDEDIRRRYDRSLAHLPAVLRIADDATLYDNSDDRPRIVLETHGGIITWRGPNEPAWVTRVCENLLSQE
jgi:predicted ABC-type ATPase